MKNLKRYLVLFSFLFLFFIPKVHAQIVFPYPDNFDTSWPYIVSYDGGDGGLFHITYCKNSNYTLHLKTEYPLNSSGAYNGNDVVFIGDCYDSDGTYVGSAYHNRSTTSVPLTQEEINDYDFDVDFNWRDYENQSYIGLFIDSTTRKIKTWKNYEGQIDEYTYDSVVLDGNTSIYNTSTLYDEVLLSPEDYLTETTTSNCATTSQKFLGQASNITSFFFDIQGSVRSSDEVVADGYVKISSAGFTTYSPNELSVTFDLLSDSSLSDISDLNINYEKSFSANSDGINDIIINFTITGTYNGGFDDYVHLVMNVDFSNNYISGITDEFYFYSKNNVCNGTIIGYGYQDNRSGLSFSNNPILENYIKDYSPPDISFFNNLTSILPPGPVDSILTLPLSILNSLVSNLGGSCTPISLTLPFINSNISLPCMNSFYSSIGLSNFMSWLGIVVSVIMLINYFVYLYNWIESILMLSHKKFKAWGTGEV